VHGLKDHDHASHFGFMRPQAGERRIAPVGETDDFAALSFRLRHVGRFQDLETAGIEKERVIPEQIVLLGDRRMIVGKNLSLELAQGLFQLCRI
jgi:hypothetical protein